MGKLTRELLKDISDNNANTSTVNISSDNSHNLNLFAKYLSKNTIVHTLVINKSTLTSAFIKALGEIANSNTSWVKLDLSINNLEELEELCNGLSENLNTKLHSLILSINCIAKNGAVGLSKLMESNRSLHILDLHFNKLGDPGVVTLVNGLKKNTTLKVLILSSNEITAIGAKALGELLGANSTLQKIILDCNPLKDEGIANVSVGLKTNTSLLSLSLCQCEITGLGIRSFYHNLNSAHPVYELKLSRNLLQKEQAIGWLSKLLASNASPDILFIDENNLTTVHLKQIAAGFAKNIALRHLNLIGNKITIKGIESLAKGVKGNFFLKTIDIGTDDSVVEWQATINNIITKNQEIAANNRADFVKMMLLIACNRINSRSSQLACLPIDILLTIFQFAYVDNCSLGKKTIQVISCAKFILENIQELNKRLVNTYGNGPLIKEVIAGPQENKISHCECNKTLYSTKITFFKPVEEIPLQKPVEYASNTNKLLIT